MRSLFKIAILTVVFTIVTKIARFQDSSNTLQHLRLLYFPQPRWHYTSKNLVLKPVADVPLPPYSIFLTCQVNPVLEKMLLCFYRFHMKREMKSLLLSENFVTLDNSTDLLEVKGEDPRSFTWNNQFFVIDNFWGDMHLMQISVSSVHGKPTGLAHNEKLNIKAKKHQSCTFKRYSPCLD